MSLVRKTLFYLVFIAVTLLVLSPVIACALLTWCNWRILEALIRMWDDIQEVAVPMLAACFVTTVAALAVLALPENERVLQVSGALAGLSGALLLADSVAVGADGSESTARIRLGLLGFFLAFLGFFIALQVIGKTDGFGLRPALAPVAVAAALFVAVLLVAVLKRCLAVFPRDLPTIGAAPRLALGAFLVTAGGFAQVQAALM